MEKPNKEEFELYVSVQQSGITNMWDIDRVIELSNYVLTQEMCFYIMKNYADLKEEYT